MNKNSPPMPQTKSETLSTYEHGLPFTPVEVIAKIAETLYRFRPSLGLILKEFRRCLLFLGFIFDGNTTFLPSSTLIVSSVRPPFFYFTTLLKSPTK